MVISWTLTHGFCQKGFVQEICNFSMSLSIENTPAVLDTTRTDIICEVLATAN